MQGKVAVQAKAYIISNSMYINNKKAIARLEDDSVTSSVFSFEYFVDYINERLQTSSVSNDFLVKARDEIVRHFDDPQYTVPLEDIEKFEVVYRQIYLLMVSPLENEDDTLWALSPALSSDFVYSTTAFYSLYREYHNHKLVTFLDFTNETTVSEKEIKELFLYSLIVKRLYGYDIFHHSDMIMKVSLEDGEKYFQFNVDERFVQIIFNGELPVIDINAIEIESLSNWLLVLLKDRLPLHRIEVRGFSIIEIKDVTFKMLKEKLKKLFLTQKIGSTFHQEISRTIKQIIGDQDLDMLLLPILEIDGKIVRELWQKFEPDISLVLTKYEVSDDQFFNLIAKFVKNPQNLRHDHNIVDRDTDCHLFSNPSSNLSEYIVTPINDPTGLTGIILVLSSHTGITSELMLSNLDDLLPLMQNMFNAMKKDFLDCLDKIIKNKFTSIQPSVAWKFNSAGIKFIKEKELHQSVEISDIDFQEVYPIYGAIDFRNSTIERNKAQFEDFFFQLNELKIVLHAIGLITKMDLIDQLICQADHWIEKLKANTLSSNEEYGIMTFLNIESSDIIRNITHDNSKITEIAGSYLIKTDDKIFFSKNKLALENSFDVLNSCITSILDDMSSELQDTYPCYFERYRTDGVEFNLYIGQSISPDKPFSSFYVKNARLWQLKMMASIARITETAQDILLKQVQITQLIFVHPNKISITFRNDEKRFDVEGSYNIRYEIAKKRIDKAMLKDSSERLTQPGKIAIVYYHRNDIEDYLQHISYLQVKGILEPEVEDLELEDMQGVSGLKAMRVKVINNHLELKEEKYLLRIKNQNNDGL